MNRNGILIVIGGPGASGCSTIAKKLAEHFNLKRIYGGELMRNFAKEKGFATYEQFLESDFFKENSSEIDRRVDDEMIKHSSDSDILIESKIFAAIATIRQIPCSVKIWLDASLEVRAHRALTGRSGIKHEKHIDEKSQLYKDTVKKLTLRYENDKERYNDLYGIDYSKPELYNDIVLDSSDLDAEQTIKLVLEKIKDGGFIK